MIKRHHRGGSSLLTCKAGAPRTEHYQLVRALSAGAVVTVLQYWGVEYIGVNSTAFGRKLTLFQRHPAFPLFT